MSETLAQETPGFKSPDAAARPLLAEDEPRPFRLVNAQGRGHPVLFVCDHASNFVPRALDNLGLPPSELRRHIAFDIGIAGVAERVAALLDAPLVLSQFSRLVVDPNRPPQDPTLAPAISDGTIIEGNRDLAPEALEARKAAFYEPYHRAIAQQLQRMLGEGLRPAFVSLHSMTPMMRGERRPWEISLLWNDDPRLPQRAFPAFRARGLSVGDNQPYSGQDGHGCTVHRHAEPLGLANLLIEVRQDLVDTPAGQEQWAGLLAEVLSSILQEADLRRDWNEERRHGGAQLHRRD
jgi:predicted N-formylglutamate amidohydrolase